MATNFLWGNVGSVVGLLANELNALADGSASAYGAEVNNVNGPKEGTLHFYIDANNNTFTTASYVRVLLVPSTTPGAASGTYPNFTSGSSYKLAETNYWAADIYINPSGLFAGTYHEMMPYVRLPSGYWKPVLINHTGFAMPSTNLSKLELYTTPTQY